MLFRILPILVLFLNSCQTTEQGEKKVFKAGVVYADYDFAGARLNDFIRLNDSSYQAIVNPEATPINNSPWYSFSLWSETEANIQLELIYPDSFEHRYIPKISRDGYNWQALDQAYYEYDSLEQKFTMQLSLSKDKLWVSAQENLNSDYIFSWMDSLAKTDNITQSVVGKSVSEKPVKLLKISDETQKLSLILIGRQHPPEVPGGTIALMAFVDALLSKDSLAEAFRAKFEILVFPLLNPDGVDAGYWRYNANGVDLNRDWIDFSQPETKSVQQWILGENQKNFCFGIDFHTSFSGPYLLTLDTIPHEVKPFITTNWINEVEAHTGDTLDIRPRAQALPYCYNWMINELGIEAVTYEEGDEIERQIVKQRAKNYAHTLMNVLLEKYNN